MELNLVAETADKIFADMGTPRAAIDARDPAWRDDLWQALEENGLPLAWVPEDCGGIGFGLAEGFEIARVAGKYAASLPLVETLLAGWLLGCAGIACPAGRMSVAPMGPGAALAICDEGKLTGLGARTPYAREAGHFAVLATRAGQNYVALVSAADCTIDEGSDLSGDARDTVVFNAITPIALAAVPFDAERLLLMGGTLRAAQIAGSLQAMLDLSVQYAGERKAFGKFIGKFQAVQQSLARLAGEVAAASSAATSAADTIVHAESWDEGVFLEAVAAKVRSCEAVEEAMLIAHQVHGAIGVTAEHVLHRYTLRAVGWCDDFGNESHWARLLGEMIASRGSAYLWELVASR
jgi:acyl-CoA dehydrogenase